MIKTKRMCTFSRMEPFLNIPMGSRNMCILNGTHPHHHSHAQTKAVLNRLSRAIGHMESIKRMVEDGRDCSEVLIQLSAVKSAINNTGKIILQDHIEHCIVDAVEHGDRDAIKELEKAIDRFMK